MITSFYKTLLTIIFTGVAFSALSQASTLPDPGKIAKQDTLKPDDKSKDASSSFKFGVNYLSNNVFMGRTDTTRTPIILPQVKYTFKNGIYVSGVLDIIPNNKTKKLDGGDLAAGYDFDITPDFTGGVSFTKLFYSSTSTQISAAIRSTINANLIYDFGNVVSASVSADYNIDKQGIKNDIFLNAGLSHDFIIIGVFGKTDFLLISPTAALNSGSQNFYDSYLVQRTFKRAKLNALETTLINQYTSQLSKFELLDYELSVPIEYKSGHFIFQLIPTYAIVENQLPKQIAATFSSQSSVFYFQAGITLKF
jgi:hypothetical protein